MFHHLVFCKGIQLIILFSILRTFIDIKEKKTIILVTKEETKRFIQSYLHQIKLCRKNFKIIGALNCQREYLDNGRSYADESINVSYCFFLRSTIFSGDGGVIFTSGGSYNLRVFNTMFYNCVCSNYGGAIYFCSSNSILFYNCGNRCSCGVSSNYHFAYISSQENNVDYLSVANCSHSTNGYYTFRFVSGKQRVDHTNSSMNKAFLGSGICIDSPISFTSSIAHSRIIRHPTVFAYTSFQTQESCYLLTLFIITVHSIMELYMPMKEPQK